MVIQKYVDLWVVKINLMNGIILQSILVKEEHLRQVVVMNVLKSYLKMINMEEEEKEKNTLTIIEFLFKLNEELKEIPKINMEEEEKEKNTLTIIEFLFKLNEELKEIPKLIRKIDKQIEELYKQIYKNNDIDFGWKKGDGSEG
jgi:hypothetical protein